MIARYEQAPGAWGGPLAAKLSRAGADGDSELIAAARALLDLAGWAADTPKYVADVRGSQGVQVGDGNRQDNAYTIQGSPDTGRPGESR